MASSSVFFFKLHQIWVKATVLGARTYAERTAFPHCHWELKCSSLKFNFLSNNLLCWIIWHLLASHFRLIFSVWLMFWSKKACSCGATEAEPQTGLSDLMTDHLTFSQFYQQICTQVKIYGKLKKVGAVCNLPALANQRLAWAGGVGTGGSTQLNSPWSEHNFWQENMSTQGIPYIRVIFEIFCKCFLGCRSLDPGHWPDEFVELN